jgi:predicted lipid-binding transport protein (Tim44 family)
MKTSHFSLWALAFLLVVAPASARPGGGNTYRSGGSDYGSGSESSGSGWGSGSKSSGSDWGSGSKSSGSGWGSSRSSSTDYGSGITTYGSSPYREPPSYGGSSGYHAPSTNGNLGLELLIGMLLLGGVGIGWIAYVRRKDEQMWSSSLSIDPSWEPPPMPQGPSPRTRLSMLRRYDPGFSVVLFEDFLYALFARVHETRGGDLDALSAYLTAAAVADLRGMAGVERVEGIVIGAMHIADVSARGDAAGRIQAVVVVEFEANYTERARSGGEEKDATIYAVERWTLRRNRDARSRPPEKVRVFDCPNCGAALSAVRSSTCTYCSKVVNTGEFDWVVERIQGLHRDRLAPDLTGSAPERGTDLPTVEDPEAPGRLRALAARDPSFSWPGFQARVATIFDWLQKGWSDQQWEIVRPYVSDALFQMQLYWIETYKRQGLRNFTERARIAQIQCVVVTADAYFDAITVRLYASSLDYTVRTADNVIVGGSKERPREYTEYWTLIRSIRPKQAAHATGCPNCGAEVLVNMAGHCQFCNAKVTSGEFDWVLSRIEQDESYRG